MADSYQLFNEIREAASREKGAISNVKALGLKADAKALHILWMYPDVLNVFGSRGDIMALMRVSCAMGIPTEIKRIDSLSENIDFLSAVRTYQITHIFYDADDRNIHHLRHAGRFLNDHGDQILRRGDDNDPVHRK